MTREEFINWFEQRFALTKNDIYELGHLTIEKEMLRKWILPLTKKQLKML